MQMVRMTKFMFIFCVQSIIAMMLTVVTLHCSRFLEMMIVLIKYQGKLNWERKSWQLWKVIG